MSTIKKTTSKPRPKPVTPAAKPVESKSKSATAVQQNKPTSSSSSSAKTTASKPSPAAGKTESAQKPVGAAHSEIKTRDGLKLSDESRERESNSNTASSDRGAHRSDFVKRLRSAFFDNQSNALDPKDAAAHRGGAEAAQKSDLIDDKKPSIFGSASDPAAGARPPVSADAEDRRALRELTLERQKREREMTSTPESVLANRAETAKLNALAESDVDGKKSSGQESLKSGELQSEVNRLRDQDAAAKGVDRANNSPEAKTKTGPLEASANEQPAKTELSARLEKATKAEPTGKAEPSGKADASDATEKSKKAETADKTDSTEKAKKAESPEKAEASDKTNKSEKSDKAEKTEKSDQPEKLQQTAVAQAIATEAVGHKKSGKASGQSEKGAERFYDASGPIGLKRPVKKSAAKALDNSSESKTVAKAQASDSKTAAKAADRFYDSTGPIGLKRPAKKSSTKALDSNSESKTVAKAQASESKTVAKAADRFYDSSGPIGLKRPTKRTAPKAAEPAAEAVTAKVSPNVARSEEPRYSDAKTSRQESRTVQVVESQDRTPAKQPEAPKEEHKSGLFGALESLGDRAKEVAGGVVDTAKDIAGTAVDKAKETSGSAIDKTREVLSTVVDKTKDVAGNVVDKAKDGATGIAGAATAAAGIGKAVGSIFSQVGGVLAAAQAEKETPVKDVIVPTSQEYKDRAKSLAPALSKVEDPAKRAELEKILAGNGRIDDSVLKSFGEKGSFDVVPDSDPRLKAGDQTRQAVFNYDNGRISLAEGAFQQGALNNVVLEELGHFNDDRLLSNPATSEGWNKLTERGLKAERGGRSINANSKSSEAEYASEIQAAYWKGPKSPDYWAAALAHPKDFKEVARIAGRGDLSEETSVMDGLRGTVAHLFGGRDITAHNQHRGDFHTDDQLAEPTSSSTPRQPRFPGSSALLNDDRRTTPFSHNLGGDNTATPKPETPPVATTPKPETPPVATTPKPETPPVATTPKPETPPVVATTPKPETPPVATTPKPETPPVATTPKPETPPVATTPKPEAPPVVTTPKPETPPVATTPKPEAPPPSTNVTTNSNSTSSQSNFNNQNFVTQQSNFDTAQSQLSNLQQSQINGALDQIQGQLNAPGSAFQDLQRIDSMLQQSPQLQNAMGDLNQLASNLGSLKDLPQVAAHLEGLADLSHSLAGIPDAVRGGQQVTELIQQVKDLPKGAKLEDHPQVSSALMQLPKAVAELDKLPGLVKATQELPQHIDKLKALPEIVQGSAELAKDKQLMGNLKQNLTTTAQVVAPAPQAKTADNDAAAKRPAEATKDKLANPEKTPTAAVPSNTNAAAPKPLPRVAERVAELLKVDLATTPQVNNPAQVEGKNAVDKQSTPVKAPTTKEPLELSVGVPASKAKLSIPAAKTVSMGSKSLVNTTVRMQELPKMARDLSKVAQLAPETTVSLKSFLQVAQAPETQKTLQTLKSWATTPAGKDHPAQQGLDTLKSATQDPALKREVVRLENALKPIIGKESFARTVQHLEHSLNTKAAIQEALPSLQAASRPEVREAANTLRAATLDRRTTTQLDRLHGGVQTIHEAKRASQSIVRQPQETKAPTSVNQEPVPDLFELLGKTVHESLASKRLEAKSEGFDVFVPRRLGAKSAPSAGTPENMPAERPSKPALLLGGTRSKSPAPLQQPAAEHTVHHDHTSPVQAAPMVAEKHLKAAPVKASPEQSAPQDRTPVVTAPSKPAVAAPTPSVAHREIARTVTVSATAQVDKPISVGPSEAPVASASKSVNSGVSQQKQAEAVVQQTLSAQLGMQAAPQVPLAPKAPVEAGPIGNREKSFKQSTQAVRSLTTGKGTNDQLWSLVYHSRTREGAKGLMDTLETTVVKGGSKQMQKLFDASTRNSDATLAFSSVLANLSQTQGDRLLGTVLLTTDGPGGQEAVQNLFSKMSQNQESSVRLGQFLENSSKTQPGVRGLNELIENWTQPAHDLDWSGANQLGSVLSGSSKTILGSRAVGETLKNIAAEEGGGQTIARTLNRMSRSKEGSQEATSLLQNLTFDQNGANETSKLLARASQSRDGARQVLDSFLNMSKTPSGVRNVGEVFNQLADSPQAANVWANFAKDTSNTGPLAELMEKMNSNPEASALLGQAFEKMADNPKNRGVWKVFEGRVETSTLLTQEYDRAQQNASEASNYAKSSSAVATTEESSSLGKSDREAEQELPAKAAAAEASGQLSRAEAAQAQRAVEAQNLQAVLKTEFEGRLEESRHSTELYSGAEKNTESSKTEETPRENKGSFRPGDYYSEETLKQAKICGQCGYRTTSLGFCPRCAVNNQDG